MDKLTLGLFCAGLLLCVSLDGPILGALAFGLILFMAYGRWKGFSFPALFRMALRGVMTVKNILITFLLIGVLTAFWRASGTIAVIVAEASGCISPSIFLFMVFLLNALISTLTGTSFGTAATMGVICAAMGRALGVDPLLWGGAVLAGAFAGDRCSPVSTSALLVAQLTGTNIFDNLKGMVRTGALPFLLSCAIYAALGLAFAGSGDIPDMTTLFSRGFTLHWAALIPAVLILAMALARIPVQIDMLASIAVAAPLCVFLQGMPVEELLSTAIFGYHAADPVVASMVDGGGVLSMGKTAGIVCLSSSYAGIFEDTGLLSGLKAAVGRLAEKATPFAAVLATGLLTGMLSCNQTLAQILTAQLCDRVMEDRSALALALEDTVIVTSALIPWSIACMVPLDTIGAPTAALVCAFYLYVLPLWRLGDSFLRKVRNA